MLIRIKRVKQEDSERESFSTPQPGEAAYNYQIVVMSYMTDNVIKNMSLP